MSQGSLNPEIRFLGQKVCPAACLHTDTRTEWLLWAPFQGFRIFSFNLSSRIGPITINILLYLEETLSLKFSSPEWVSESQPQWSLFS